MAQPFDYSIPMPSAIASLTQGVQFGSALRQMQEQRIAAQRAAEAQKRRDEMLTDFANNPRPTAQDFMRLAAVLPKEQADTMRQSFEMLGKERQQNDLRLAGQAMAAIQSGNAEVASRMLAERAEAERNAGDAEAAQQFSVFAELAKGSPDVALKYIGLMVAQLPGGDKVIESYGKLGDEQRATALAVPQLTIEQAKAKYAGQNAAAQAVKLLQDLDIGAANLAEIRARVSAITEGQKLEAKGVVPSDKRFDVEAKLRKEYSDQTKVFQEVASAYGRLQSAEPTAAGDLALIFQYMKMLDPGSVVREGEFANAQNAAGAGDRVRNIYNRLLSGERLNADQRKQFTSQAGALYNTERQRAEIVRQGISRIAQGAGLNVENLFYGEMEAPAPQAGGQSRTVTVDY